MSYKLLGSSSIRFVKSLNSLDPAQVLHKAPCKFESKVHSTFYQDVLVKITKVRHVKVKVHKQDGVIQEAETPFPFMLVLQLLPCSDMGLRRERCKNRIVEINLAELSKKNASEFPFNSRLIFLRVVAYDIDPTRRFDPNDRSTMAHLSKSRSRCRFRL